jgi:ribosomal protein L21E
VAEWSHENHEASDKMTDTVWTGYVGMVTGIVGAVIGIAAYLRSNKIKKLDLRLELRKGLFDDL